MIRFVDVNTGNVFNGNKPYIHWLEGKQSVGLNYDKQFIVISDMDQIDIALDSEVFSLVELGVHEERQLYEKQYIDLNSLKVKRLHYLGTQYGDYYIYSFNIIAQGIYVGEITDTFTINEEEFEIGADFIDENESLSTNLINFGAEISNEVQRAIYEKDINEQKTDYVLLNRKFKELLNEYINVLANKGSYKSLINSLNWFEYGDITKIYEYWKHHEPNQNYLSKRDLTQFVNEQTESLLYSNAKTTYIGISAALEKIKMSNGEIDYEDKYKNIQEPIPHLVDEPNPLLEEVSMLWNKREMSLKMVLLGNFFATYFLPIHLDLIHCTIEDIVYANTLKIVTFPKFERVDVLDEMNTIQCDIQKVYHLSDIETFTNPETPFGFNHSSNFDLTDQALEILGVDTELKYKYEIESYIVNTNKAYNLQHFKGIGTIVPFHCILHNLFGSSVITDAKIKVYKEGIEDPILERETNNIVHTPKENKVNIDFNILIKEIGKYKVQLVFRRSDGFEYIRVFDFEVDGESYPVLKMYKIVPKNSGVIGEINDISKWIQDVDDDTKSIELGNIADYVLNPVQYKMKLYNVQEITEPSIIYTQFISATRENIKNTIHTNQVIIIQRNDYDDMWMDNIKMRSSIGNFNLSDKSSYMPDVIWFTMDRSGHFIEPSSEDVLSEWDYNPDDPTTYKQYLIGINKTPNIDGVESSLYSVVDMGVNKVWIRDMFIPYFYKLEPFGEKSLFEIVSENLTEEDLFKIRNAKDTYTLNKTDVVCFLPDLKCVRRPNNFMWKYICCTTNKEIIPKTFRTNDQEIEKDGTTYIKVLPNDNKNKEAKPFPTILQPLFGRYDFRVLPDAGFYDIIFNYKLGDNQENMTKTISSQFIISKN